MSPTSMAQTRSSSNTSFGTKARQYLWLGYLAYRMDGFEYAKDCYEKSIEIDERIPASDRAASSRSSLDNICLTMNQRRAP